MLSRGYDMDNTTQIAFRPRVEGLPPQHRATEAARAELLELMRMGKVEPDASTQAVQGSKGLAADILLWVGGPAGVTAVLSAWRSWLARDVQRVLDVTIRDRDGGETQIKVSGTPVSRKALERALGDALAGSRNSRTKEDD